MLVPRSLAQTDPSSAPLADPSPGEVLTRELSEAVASGATAPETTLDRALAKWACKRPDHPACIFLADDGTETALTYAQLDRSARAIAASLLKRVAPGERVLLVYPAGLDFIAAFLGCQYAGIVAVPATHPKPRRPMPRMTRIAEDCGARFVLTNRATLDAIDFSRQDDVVKGLEWLATDEATDSNDDEGEGGVAHSDPESLAFLQYTSGSTSEPKGVMVSQANLAANLEAIRTLFGIEEQSASVRPRVGVFWLPAYHDMGLIGGVLTPLWVGGTTVLMSPGSFLQKPIRWLQAISDFGASISGAPNFAYDYCVRRIKKEDCEKLDLSGWRLAFSGAEPVRAETLHRFADAFEPAGFNARAFYPCYGLAEATLLAAGADHDDNPTLLSVDRESVMEGHVRIAEEADSALAYEVVGCGRAPAGHRVLIADSQTLEPLSERRVGEILISGPSVTTGYWNRSELNDSLWATLSGSDETEKLLRTGDLGFIHAGELFVTGRLKDVIVLRGKNHYPQDIEQTAEESHPAVFPGAAFTTGEGEEERLVLVAQVDRSSDKEQREEIARAIRTAISESHGLDTAAVVLIRQATLPITSSGKVQRLLCRDRYLAGELRVLHELKREKPKAKSSVMAPTLPADNKTDQPRTTEEIEAWLGRWLSARLGLEASEMARDQPFADLGVDSLTAVELSGELERAFGVPLPPVVAWNYPTPMALAGYLAEQSAKPDPTSSMRDEIAPPIAAGSSTADVDVDVEALLADIENLSDKEAARLLEE